MCAMRLLFMMALRSLERISVEKSSRFFLVSLFWSCTEPPTSPNNEDCDCGCIFKYLINYLNPALGSPFRALVGPRAEYSLVLNPALVSGDN